MERVGENERMARRGYQLREHILWVAKDVFLELGFERTSMDVVAGRAETSKRTVYAHFENKEKLFLAVIALVRGLFLSRLGTPGEYAAKPAEALVLFCGRYLQTMLYEPSIQMCRVSMAETERFPEQARQYFEVLFTEVQARLGTYLETLGLEAQVSAAAAQKLLGQVLYPRFARALFGIDPLAKSLNDEAVAELKFDWEPIWEAVAELLKSVGKSMPPV